MSAQAQRSDVTKLSQPQEVVLAETFQQSMKRLTGQQQAAVFDAIGKLQRGLGVNLHDLEGGLPWWSFYVNQNALRVICHREGGTCALTWVDTHDDAYAWAARHRFQRFGNVIRLLRVTVDNAPPPAPAAAANDVAPPGPLAEIRDKTFRLFDVGPPLAAVLRTVADESVLLDLCEHLKTPIAEALVSLATDPDGLDGIVARYVDAKNGAEVKLADAVKAPINAERLWVAPPEQRALEAALAGDSATWRVFLHPSQKRLVEVKSGGPFLVTGGPGTGKTVVALHRARTLVDRLGATAELPVLVTTFSRVLASSLEDGLRMVCRDAPTLLERMTVKTLNEAARFVLAKAGRPNALLVREDVDAAWAETLKTDEPGLGRKFYESEREEVVLANGVTTEDAYLRASRTGRGERLDRARKKRIWEVLARFEAALERRGGDDAGGLARRAEALLREHVVASPFAAVVCDEVQDASPWELRLLAALGTAAGDRYPGLDRVFLVGDGHQRLYQRPTSLRACGLEVRGRSARLRLNYRTTQGICAAALDALEGLEADVLDAEDAGDTQGYRSVRAGERPKRQTFATADEEADFIAQSIRATAERPFLVLARTRKTLDALQDKLRTRGLSVTMLGDSDALPAGDHIVLTTLHRSKGLEAPRVILAGMQERPLRFPGGSDADRELWARKERLLMYVGMTRARDWCALTRVGR